MSESILKLHNEKTGKVSDKWSSYLHYYDKLFYPKRMDPIDLLEIGVQNGGSLETWASYFPNARNIIGCDIDVNCMQLQYDDRRIKLIVDDCNSIDTHRVIKNMTPTLDIVIDDGSHRSMDILQSFVTYFPMLNPGGIYVVEDTHTLYWQEWGGELSNPHNAYIFFKKLIDVVNHQFWDKQMTIDSYLSDFFNPGMAPEFIRDGSIESIEFRNSIITIKKALSPSRDGLGKRLVTGTKALVNHHVKKDHQG